MLESNVYPGSLQPEDLGTREEEAATWCQVCSMTLTSPTPCSVCPQRRAREGVERTARTGPGEWSARGSTAGQGRSVGTWWGEYWSPIPALLQAISNQTADRVWLDGGKLVATEAVRKGGFLAQVGEWEAV